MNARLLGGGAAALILVGLLLCTRSATHSGPVSASPLPDGGEIVAIDTNIVTEVQYEKRDRKLAARRTDSTAPFDIEITNRSGDLIERCVGGQPFADTLAALATIHVNRALNDSEAKALRASHGADFALLRIADATTLEPQEYSLLVNSPGSSVVLVDGPTAYESTVPTAPIERLEAGCAALEAKPPR